MAKRFSNAALALLLASGALYAQQYFPAGVLDKKPQADQVKANWYSNHLKDPLRSIDMGWWGRIERRDRSTGLKLARFKIRPAEIY